MTVLDDPAALRAADPGGMLHLVTRLGDHCREGYALGLAARPLPEPDGITSIVVCGMGGSAIAGDVVAALAAPRLRLPVLTVRAPQMPEFCGPHTLVVASSYSGDTAETVSLFEEAVARGCRLIAVTAGGELGRRAEELGIGRVIVPTGLMPRAAFGFLTLGTLGALEAMGIVPTYADDVEESIGELAGVVSDAGPDIPLSSNPAKELAGAMGDRVPVVWGAEGIGAVAATRWRCQFNENAKVPSFAAALPELDHNEVVGWSAGSGVGFAVIGLRHPGEDADVTARFPPSLEIARNAGASVHEVQSRGRSELARLLTLVQFGDLVSTYLGIVRGVDPSPIEAIVNLKRALAQA